MEQGKYIIIIKLIHYNLYTIFYQYPLCFDENHEFCDFLGKNKTKMVSELTFLQKSDFFQFTGNSANGLFSLSVVFRCDSIPLCYNRRVLYTSRSCNWSSKAIMQEQPCPFYVPIPYPSSEVSQCENNCLNSVKIVWKGNELFYFPNLTAWKLSAEKVFKPRRYKNQLRSLSFKT